jgi:hypothetical protein
MNFIDNIINEQVELAPKNMIKSQVLRLLKKHIKQ